MRLHRSTGSVLVSTAAAFLLFGCGETAPFGPASVSSDAAAPASTHHGASQQPRPFRLDGVGFLAGQQLAPGFPIQRSDFGGRCSVPSDLILRFNVEGNATHLGAVTASLEHCSRIDFSTGLSTYGDGVMTVGSSNGDELHATYTGASVAAGAFQDQIAFAGGTGRFAGASGSATATGRCDRATATCPVYEMEGWLAYDASNRAAGD